MERKEIVTVIYEYQPGEPLSEEDTRLIEMSKKATQTAYAPYSHFKVGSAVLLENGEIISGSNQENAAYPSGLCAERVALFYANALYPDVAVKSIAIATASIDESLDIPVSPCGGCRQVLMETESRFGKPVRVILVGKRKIRIIEDAKQLLPVGFDQSVLNAKETKGDFN